MAGPRARDLGLAFEGQPGARNAITDVPGVEVGHLTLVEGELESAVRTGVTAVLPRGRAGGLDEVAAGWFSLNGNGEMTGTAWIDEAGRMGGPVMLTNTHSVGIVRDAVIAWARDRGALGAGWALPVVAETFDGFLNDINGLHLRAEHARAALDAAAAGPVPEGNVGGGTGMITAGFKGGIGTASRQVERGLLDRSPGPYSLGVLVQSNYGLRQDLTVLGVPVGREIPELAPESPPAAPARDGTSPRDGSIIVVVATDAPLLPHQLRRVARRAGMGLARTGSVAYNGSGDLFLAVSTAGPGPAEDGLERWTCLPEPALDPVFRAAVQATEEAIANALVGARTMTGYRGRVVHALPHDRLSEVMRRYGRLA